MMQKCLHREDNQEEECLIMISDNLHYDCNNELKWNKTCAKTNKYYDLCRSFVAPIGGFQNLYCGLCNGIKARLTTRSNLCYMGGAEWLPFSWSTLLQLKEEKSQETTNTFDDRNNECKNKTMFEKISSKCISFYCPIGYTVNGTKCIKIQLIHQDGFDQALNFDHCLVRFSVNVFIRNTLFVPRLLKSIYERESKKEVGAGSILTALHGNETILTRINNSTFQYFISKEFLTSSALYPDGRIIISPAGETRFNHHQNLNDSQLFPDDKICAEPVRLGQSISFTNDCNAISNSALITRQNLALWIEVRTNRITRNLYTCHKFYSPSKSWFSIINEVSSYVSIIGSACSIISYCVIIFAVCYFKELQTISSQCATILNISLMFGDGLFITSNILNYFKYRTSTIVCISIGILIHFSLLISHVIGVIISIDIYNNITKIRFISYRERSILVKYGLISFCVPLSVIVIGIVLREAVAFDLSYSLNGMCTLHGIYARAFLYFAPLAICFVISLTAIILSIHLISKEKKNNGKVLQQRKKENKMAVVIALKLIILCGVPEGIGFVNIPATLDSTDAVLAFNSIFGLLYSFLKGFRGVLMLCSFCCSNAVVSVLWGKKTMRQSTQ